MSLYNLLLISTQYRTTCHEENWFFPIKAVLKRWLKKSMKMSSHRLCNSFVLALTLPLSKSSDIIIVLSCFVFIVLCVGKGYKFLVCGVFKLFVFTDLTIFSKIWIIHLWILQYGGWGANYNCPFFNPSLSHSRTFSLTQVLAEGVGET